MSKKENPEKETIALIIWIFTRNAWRWRWRLLTIATLLTLSFTMHILYGIYMQSIVESGVARTDPLTTVYFDLMVVPGEYQSILDREDLPPTRFRRQLYGYGEAGSGLVADSIHGRIELLGLHQDSGFFSFAPEEIEGRSLQHNGEILLPRSLAEGSRLTPGDSFDLTCFSQFQLRSLTVTLVGIYDDNCSQPLALISFQDACTLRASTDANRYLIDYDRVSGEANLEYLAEWMGTAYPGALLLYDGLPEALSQTMLSRIVRPSSGLLLLIFTFMGVGVLTVAMMTFLERRSELATLKSVGLSRDQLINLQSLEYGISLVLGLALGIITTALLGRLLPWYSAFRLTDLLSLGLTAAFSMFFVLVCAVAFPTLTAQIATVNELLHARVIPLRKLSVRRLRDSQGELILRELDENVRILAKPISLGRDPTFTFLCLKQVGDMVKQGEVIGVRSTKGGLEITQWKAWCDGTVVEDNTGFIVIKPSDPEASFYPYSPTVIQEHRRRRERFEEGRR
ncbi:MAG: hypothetical protein FWE76_04955, partial [Symbiobacteriaceae bacterium]|nr:hypothetical protein [Symbiobacteriaceae bacterium]